MYVNFVCNELELSKYVEKYRVISGHFDHVESLLVTERFVADEDPCMCWESLTNCLLPHVAQYRVKFIQFHNMCICDIVCTRYVTKGESG